MITKLFWKTFYRITLPDYTKSVREARLSVSNIKTTTKGDLSIFYNVNGENIRGWHKSINGAHKHPLVKKYYPGKNR